MVTLRGTCLAILALGVTLCFVTPITTLSTQEGVQRGSTRLLDAKSLTSTPTRQFEVPSKCPGCQALKLSPFAQVPRSTSSGGAWLGPGIVQNTLCLQNNVLTPGLGGPCGGSSGEIAVNSRGNLAFVAGPNATKAPYPISVVNLSTDHVIASVPIPQSGPMSEVPFDPIFDSINNTLLIPLTNPNQNCNISVMNVATETLVGKIVYGHQCASMLFDNTTNEIYIIYFFGQIIVLNGTTYSRVATINMTTAGSELFYAALDPLSDEIYVSNGNFVSVIGAANHTVVANIYLGGGATLSALGITFDERQDTIYVAEPGNNSVGVIDALNNSLLRTLATAGNPSPITYNPFNDFIYLNTASGTQAIEPSTDTIYGTYGFTGAMAAGSQDGGLLLASGGNLLQIGPPRFQLTFNETGLTPGTAWNVSVGGSTFSSTSSIMQFNELNGSYNYSIPAVAGYTNSPSSGTVTISGSSMLVATVFTAIPTIQSVTLSPMSTVLYLGNITSFHATPSCANGPCPSNVTLAWSLNNTLGNLSLITGPATNFTAGGSPGNVTITVNASLAGKYALAAGHITVVSAPVIPTLQSVLVSPPLDTLQSGSSAYFSAEPSCQNGPCPNNLTFRWSMNNSLGSLSGSTLSTASFKAGSVSGNVNLTVRVGLGGTSKVGSAIINIVVTPVPTLVGVTMSPSNDTLYLGDSSTFSAKPICSNGPCPNGVSFVWVLSNSLGQLNATFGPSVRFFAGEVPGNVSLTVKATLNGGNAQLATSGIQISRIPVPTLTGVTLSPSSVTIQPQGTVLLSTTIQCSSGNACPSGTVYAWLLASPSLGNLNSSTDVATSFHAGFGTGTEKVSVTATLNGFSEKASALIQITTKSTGSEGGVFGIPGWYGYLLIGIVAAIILLAVILVVLRRRRRAESDEGPDMNGEPQ